MKTAILAIHVIGLLLMTATAEAKITRKFTCSATINHVKHPMPLFKREPLADVYKVDVGNYTFGMIIMGAARNNLSTTAQIYKGNDIIAENQGFIQDMEMKSTQLVIRDGANRLSIYCGTLP